MQPTPSVLFSDADNEIQARVRALLETQERVIIAIDGNCCAGKTTLAERLKSLLSATVFHLDDYFLQPHMRTPERLQQPGGNVDAERFLADVLLPVSRGEHAKVRKYDCHEDMLLEAVSIAPNRVNIVEGAYSLHPLLSPYYSLKIFCRATPTLQIARIRKRNGEDALSMFLNRWIPLENAYFEALDIESQCDIIIEAEQT